MKPDVEGDFWNNLFPSGFCSMLQFYVKIKKSGWKTGFFC